VKSFIQKMARGEQWPIALRQLEVPPSVIDFVEGTLNCAIHGSVVEVAAYFFFGREDVIPDMFERLLKLWDHGAVEVPFFAYYLKRHIELDGDSHGPWAREMLITLAGQDESSWTTGGLRGGVGHHQPHQTLGQCSNVSYIENPRFRKGIKLKPLGRTLKGPAPVRRRSLVMRRDGDDVMFATR